MKIVLFKNFKIIPIYNNLKLDNILHIILIIKKLIVLYILFYYESLFKNQIVFINSIKMLNNNLKIIYLLTYNPYINTSKIFEVFSNWEVIKKKIILLKWLLYLLHFINNKKIKLPIHIIVKIFKLFLKLKNSYWGILHTTHHTYTCILTNNITNSVIKKYLKFNKNCIFITNTSNINYNNLFFIINNEKFCLQLILEFLSTAYIQGRLYYIK